VPINPDRWSSTVLSGCTQVVGHRRSFQGAAMSFGRCDCAKRHSELLVSTEKVGRKMVRRIHTEKSNKTRQCIKIYYSIFIWSSTCFGQHIAHHQEPKTALAASGFAYVEGCWTVVAGCCQALPDNVQQPRVQKPPTYSKPEAVSAVLGSCWWAMCRPKHVELHINME